MGIKCVSFKLIANFHPIKKPQTQNKLQPAVWVGLRLDAYQFMRKLERFADFAHGLDALGQ